MNRFIIILTTVLTAAFFVCLNQTALIHKPSAEDDFKRDIQQLERQLDELEKSQDRKMDEMTRRLDEIEKALFKNGRDWYPISKPSIEERVSNLEHEIEILSQRRQ